MLSSIVSSDGDWLRKPAKIRDENTSFVSEF